jgi:adenylosuccinate synthase
VAYELNGQRIEYFPANVGDLRNAIPVYETIPGWQSDVTGARTLDDLPIGAIEYVRKIESLIGRRIEFISVGPDRAQTIRVPESESVESYLKKKAV